MYFLSKLKYLFYYEHAYIGIAFLLWHVMNREEKLFSDIFNRLQYGHLQLILHHAYIPFLSVNFNGIAGVQVLL